MLFVIKHKRYLLPMQIEIIYLASPTQSFHQKLTLDAPCTVKEALLTSDLLLNHPQLSIDCLSVGIFGQKVSIDYLLNVGDRIEIYRDLTISPMEKRRLLAMRKKK